MRLINLTHIFYSFLVCSSPEHKENYCKRKAVIFRIKVDEICYPVPLKFCKIFILSSDEELILCHTILKRVTILVILQTLNLSLLEVLF
jgi:hypothetical protein